MKIKSLADVKILSERMLRIKGSAEHSRWPCVYKTFMFCRWKITQQCAVQEIPSERTIDCLSLLVSIESGDALSRPVLRTAL